MKEKRARVKLVAQPEWKQEPHAPKEVEFEEEVPSQGASYALSCSSGLHPDEDFDYSITMHQIGNFQRVPIRGKATLVREHALDQQKEGHSRLEYPKRVSLKGATERGTIGGTA